MEKEHLYLHIGTHKTGSTSIQWCLRENRNMLETNSYYYPIDGAYYYPPESSPSLLAHALLGRRPNYIGNTIIEKKRCVADIRRDIDRSACENIIISSEHFSSARTIEEIQDIAAVFTGLFKKITVIVYLRRQDTRMESSWSQSVRVGSTTRSFDDIITEPPDWDYFKMLNLWAAVFGKQNIVVRPFEKKQFAKNDLIRDFLQVVGCAIELTPAQRNESLPTELLEFMRIFVAQIPSYSERNRVLRLLMSLPIKTDSRRFALFTPEKRKRFINLYRNSNALVAREFLGREDGALFYEDESIDCQTYQGISLERFAEISRQCVLLLARINSDLASKN